jgi:outer membrane lipoprotein SlyB
LAVTSPAMAVCKQCGKVIEIREVKQEGEGSGLGAVAGGVAGGLLGNQVGKGTGKTVATVAGVAGGAYAGHVVEKKVRESTEYDVVIRMDGGATREVRLDDKPPFESGDRVKLVDGHWTRVKR